MRTDTLFYKLFQTFPQLLFEIMGEAPEQATAYQFSSREIKELARRFDGIFLPSERATNLPIYFVEVQFQSKSDFYWRFFTEIFVYLGQYKPNNDWCAVAVFASRNLDPGVPNQYRGLLMSKQVKFVYLDEVEMPAEPSLGLGIVELIVGSRETAIAQTNQLLQQAKQEIDDAALQLKVVELIETVILYKFTELTREELEAMFGLEDLKQTRFYQQAKEEGKEEGKLEGKLEGQQEGKIQGKLESIPGFLAIGLSVEQIAAALGLDVEIVRQAAQGQSNS